MDLSINRYNVYSNFGKRIIVSYNSAAPTADGNYNGNIRFGANTIYMVEGTTQHEIAHYLGVVTSLEWKAPLVQDGKFVGANPLAKIQSFDGPTAVTNCDANHFWPYGINFSNEFSAVTYERNAQLVWEMVKDGL
jgi:hypothetical protein